jgi:hypothetical protein
VRDLVAERRANRRKNVELLESVGLLPQPWLPLREHRAVIRPTEDITRRMMALGALWAWCSDDGATEAIRAHAERSRLHDALTPSERARMALPRDEARADGDHCIVDAIWSLAWILGHDPAPAFDGRAPTAEIRRGLASFSQRGLDASFEAVNERVRLRPLADVVIVEDLFYCAHNAARHAALGVPAARPAFDPDVEGPAIETRRHALTWVLSDVAWDDTDLSS